MGGHFKIERLEPKLKVFRKRAQMVLELVLICHSPELSMIDCWMAWNGWSSSEVWNSFSSSFLIGRGSIASNETGPGDLISIHVGGQ